MAGRAPGARTGRRGGVSAAPDLGTRARGSILAVVRGGGGGGWERDESTSIPAHRPRSVTGSLSVVGAGGTLGRGVTRQLVTAVSHPPSRVNGECSCNPGVQVCLKRRQSIVKSSGACFRRL